MGLALPTQVQVLVTISTQMPTLVTRDDGFSTSVIMILTYFSTAYRGYHGYHVVTMVTMWLLWLPCGYYVVTNYDGYYVVIMVTLWLPCGY